MALKMTQKKETIVVEGTINATTALNFQNHIETVMKFKEDVVIDIENVTEIDVNGMRAFRSIYAKTVASDKGFYVVGFGCKEVYDDLYMSNVA